MIDEVNTYDIVIPRISEYVEPLHAVYSKNCLPVISSMIQQNNLKIYQLLDKVKTRFITEEEIDRFDPQHLSIFNINTREAFDRVLDLIEKDSA
jgi:molybdopterin-guanine dinucleotide biosynthesis protein A